MVYSIAAGVLSLVALSFFSKSFIELIGLFRKGKGTESDVSHDTTNRASTAVQNYREATTVFDDDDFNREIATAAAQAQTYQKESDTNLRQMKEVEPVNNFLFQKYIDSGVLGGDPNDRSTIHIKDLNLLPPELRAPMREIIATNEENNDMAVDLPTGVKDPVTTSAILNGTAPTARKLIGEIGDIPADIEEFGKRSNKTSKEMDTVVAAHENIVHTMEHGKRRAIRKAEKKFIKAMDNLRESESPEPRRRRPATSRASVRGRS